MKKQYRGKIILGIIAMLVLVCLLASCAMPEPVDCTEYFGMNYIEAIAALKEDDREAHLYDELDFTVDVDDTETLYDHKFTKLLLYDLETEDIYGYMNLWNGKPTDETYAMIESLTEDLVKEFGEPDYGGRIRGNMDEIQDKLAEIQENAGEGQSYKETWSAGNDEYSQASMYVQVFSDGTLTCFVRYYD